MDKHAYRIRHSGKAQTIEEAFQILLNYLNPHAFNEKQIEAMRYTFFTGAMFLFHTLTEMHAQYGDDFTESAKRMGRIKAELEAYREKMERES